MSSMTEDDDVMSGAQGRRLPHPLALAWFGAFAGLLLTVLFIAFFGKASDGGPVVLLDIVARHPAVKSIPGHGAAAQPRPAAAQPTDLIGAGPEPGTAGEAPPAATEETATAGTPGTAAPEPALPPVIVPDRILKPVYAGKALVADPALIEATAQGPLPRIANDGRTPMAAYEPATPAAAVKDKKMIAIVITGLGISARATQAALDGLPAGVTLAFAPYAGDVQRWVGEARKRGHEVLLEVPMEPYDFPDSDPGPHTLRPMLSEDANIQRLTWALTRFTGYAGVTNLLGGRFLANADAAAPVITFLARRGLLFYDSGTTSRSAAEGIADQAKAPYLQSTTMIDSIQSGMEVDQRLSELEARARVTGAAAGTGFLYPVTIDRVSVWAKGLEGRGFVLVPASAIVGKGS